MEHGLPLTVELLVSVASGRVVLCVAGKSREREEWANVWNELMKTEKAATL